MYGAAGGHVDGEGERGWLQQISVRKAAAMLIAGIGSESDIMVGEDKTRCLEIIVKLHWSPPVTGPPSSARKTIESLSAGIGLNRLASLAPNLRTQSSASCCKYVRVPCSQYPPPSSRCRCYAPASPLVRGTHWSWQASTAVSTVVRFRAASSWTILTSTSQYSTSSKLTGNAIRRQPLSTPGAFSLTQEIQLDETLAESRYSPSACAAPAALISTFHEGSCTSRRRWSDLLFPGPHLPPAKGSARGIYLHAEPYVWSQGYETKTSLARTPHTVYLMRLRRC
ncbi:hypothetical protein R3P38DRAFT_2771741 [Favolaschia claudopus]|uniref:Uncharacterized protein n=1 Tax=Favolaschia claudopus TaxID=2862362 RepID=A0AAW0CBK7_9AGAR